MSALLLHRNEKDDGSCNIVEEKEVVSFGIGVDIGGTHILAVLTGKDGRIVCSSERSIHSKDRKDVTGVINVLVDCLESLVVKNAPSFSSHNSRGDVLVVTMEGIGLAIPGNVDPIKGTTRYLPNFGWLEEVPLASILVQRLLQSDTLLDNHNNSNSNSNSNSKKNNTVVSALLERIQLDGTKAIHMRNDGRCAALAERVFGVGSNDNNAKIDCSVFSMLTLGTGIGGALLYNTGKNNDDVKLFDGVTFDAGDFGHHVICSGKEAFPCVCGKYGCFETHASAAGLVRHYNRFISLQPSSSKFKQQSLDHAKRIVDQVQNNNNDEILTTSNSSTKSNEYSPVDAEISRQAWLLYLDDLSTGIANLITFYNPSVVVLGGKFGRNPYLYMEHQGLTLQQRVDAKTLPATRQTCQIIPGQIDAGAIGAAYLNFLL